MGQTNSSNIHQPIGEIPLKIPFKEGLCYLETDKRVYYPGETISGNIHLLVNDEITDADQLSINVRGKESFNFKCFKKNNDESCRSYYLILNHTQTLCKFHTTKIAPG